MWTRRRCTPDPCEPEGERWVIAYNGELCGSTWCAYGRWYWVTWTVPHEAGQAANLYLALDMVRAAVLRTDGTISRLRSLTGPDFPEERKRQQWWQK